MKSSIAAFASLILPFAACAQSPDVLEQQETPDVSTITEDCGEGCTRTITTITAEETDEEGVQTISKNVEVIELSSDESENVNVDINVDTISDGDTVIRKQVKVISSAGGEVSPEMQAEIDAMIADAEAEGYAYSQTGNNLVVLRSDEGDKKMRVIIRDGDSEIDSLDGEVEINKLENDDGSKTIRITPEDGSETTVITIQTEKITE